MDSHIECSNSSSDEDPDEEIEGERLCQDCGEIRLCCTYFDFCKMEDIIICDLCIKNYDEVVEEN
jgi:hypothetical protein